MSNRSKLKFAAKKQIATKECGASLMEYATIVALLLVIASAGVARIGTESKAGFLRVSCNIEDASLSLTGNCTDFAPLCNAGDTRYC